MTRLEYSTGDREKCYLGSEYIPEIQPIGSANESDAGL